LNDRQLQYILKIAKEGNITVAAQKLNISQPSLSNLLSRIEEALGAKIFDRSTSPLALTYTGEKYVQAAEKILGVLNELQHQIDDIQDSQTGRLNIGCGPQSSPVFIPPLLPRLLEQYLGVQYTLTEDSFSVLEEQLLTGNLDIILNVRELNNSSIESELLGKEEMLLLAPPGFRPASAFTKDGRSYPCIKLHLEKDIPFVLMKPKHHLRIMVDKIFAGINFIPTILLETDSWETCLRMAEKGIAFTIFPADYQDVTIGEV
jgi:LysR family cyn operon transcriptional activator